jgi:fumarate hydratase class I
VIDAYDEEPALFAAGAASMFEEKNTKTNLPARSTSMKKATTPTSSCSSPRAAARPTRRFLYQGTPSLLTHDRMIEFLREKILTLGTAACPPYHLAIVIGGTRRK